MLHELLSILRTSDPLRAIGENFANMVTTTHEMTITAVPRSASSAIN